jgi:tetratricopeptide (TPR) repeat protein
MDEAPQLLMILQSIAACGDIDEMIQAALALPEGTPLRGQFAAGLALAVLQLPSEGNLEFEAVRGEALEALLEVADQDPPQGEYWWERRAAVISQILLSAAASGRIDDYDAALAEYDELLADPECKPEIRTALNAARVTFLHLRAQQEGDESVLEGAPFDIAALRDLYAHRGGDSSSAEMLDLMELVNRVREKLALGEDSAEEFTQIADLSERFATPDNRYAEMTVPIRLAARAYRYVRGESPEGDFSADELAMLEQLAQAQDTAPSLRYTYFISLGGVYLRGGRQTDPDRIADAVRCFESARDLASVGDKRAHALLLLASALLTQAENTHDHGRLPEAEEMLEQALELIDDARHPFWPLINGALVEVRSMRSDARRHHEMLEVLNHRMWQVLLQSDPASARDLARETAELAVETAREAVRRYDAVSAIRALDSGRSLMLYAATAFRDVVSQLEAAGHADLAERWRDEAATDDPERLSGKLRHDVLSVLSEAADLLSAPSLAEMGSALTALDADALVYLVAGVGNLPGYALMVSSDGEASLMGLVELTALEDTEVESYLDALSRGLPKEYRDLRPRPHSSGQPGGLEALCEWAWRAAVGRLVEQYLRELPKPKTDRPHRLVLIPMGVLGLIPWQAAKRPGGGYAIEEVSFSFAGSARLLCRAAQLDPVEPTPVALVVGDPDTDGKAPPLTAARFEAYAVHQAFYRAGTYVGTRPNGTQSHSGAGTAQEVREWLTTAGLGTVLHLACHGVLETDPDAPNAALLLAGDSFLAATQIVPLLAEAPDRAIALAVLAACHTGSSAHGYDEAYSVGSAFLTAGVRSVLSTQWSIPDEDTSVLMFMFHHFFMRDRLPASAALRRAQLWMLDPRRVVPQTMPTPLRRRLEERGADLARIGAWAGFVHFGQ